MPLPSQLRLTPEQQDFAVKKFIQWLEDNNSKNHFDLSELLQAVQDYKRYLQEDTDG